MWLKEAASSRGVAGEGSGVDVPLLTNKETRQAAFN